MSIHTIKTAFNSGKLTPLMDPRSEVEKYASGCRELQNFIPRTYGAAFKRPGFEYLGTTKGGDEACLKAFNYSVDTRFQFEFGEQYLRFWSNGERVSLSVGSPSAWSGTTTQYTIGTPVWDDTPKTLYRAASTHTPSGGNQPPSAQWTTTNIKKWTASTVYVVGDLVAYFYNDVINSMTVNVWICTTAHTSSSSFDSTKFTRCLYQRSWFTSTAYAVGDRVLVGISGNQIRWFRCKLAHTSNSTTQPISGASYTTYWADVNGPPTHDNTSFAYKKGDLVRVSSTVYVSSTDHTSSASNEPGDVGAPWHSITGINAWGSGASTSRAVGDWAISGAMIHRCYIAHTSGSYIDMDYWDWQETWGVEDWTSTPTYSQADIVYNGTDKKLYYCVSEHATATTTEPGTTGGDAYWETLANLYYWTTGVNYLEGQYVIESGASYRVVTSHTAGTFATDLSNGLLVAEDYPLELATPYAMEDVWTVQTMQVNDIVWLLHPDYETQVLERLGDTAWRIRPVPWDWPPMRDENIEDDWTITPSATTGNITLTASEATFENGNIGGYYQISHYRDSAVKKLILNATGQTTALRVVGRLDVFIYGATWTGEVALQKSKDGSTNWQTVRTWTQPVVNMRTISTNVTTTEEVYYRLKKTVHTAGGTSDYALIEAADSRINGLVKITDVASPTIASATVISDLDSTDATTLWSESAYSERRGWPRTGTLHELRLILAGGADEPQTIRGSTVDDFFNFKETTAEDGPFSFTLAATESNAIQWVQSLAGGIAAGTVGEEWIMDSGTADRSISSTNVRAKLQSRYGSSSLPSVVIGDAAIFFQRDARRAREFTYSFDSDKYVAPDLTLLAEDITTGGIKQTAATRQPDTVLHCVTNDGRLASMTYEREQSVVAWAEHVTDGSFESVSVIYGGETDADEVWCVVKRTIDGEEVRYVERMNQDTSRFTFETMDELCYLDSAVYSEPGSTSVTGLDHLEGESVYALADGVAVGPFTVSAGSITLAASAAKVWVGLAYTALLQGMKVETAMQDGTAQGRKFRLDRLVARTHKSNGFEIHYNPDDTTVAWRTMGDADDVDDATTKPTDVELPIESRHEREIALSVRSSKPLPVNVLALIYKFNVYGD